MITLTLLFFLHFLSSHALHNVTVDNTSPLISYQGPWPAAGGGFAGYDVDDTQSTIDMLLDGASAPHATATFTFTGTAIYYWSPLWPYEIATTVTLDNQAPVSVSLIDYSSIDIVVVGSTGPSVVSDIRWFQTGLSNTQHTLTMSLMASSRYIVVDALTYTALDPSDITPPVSSTSSTTKSTGSGASSLASASSTATTHLSGSGSMIASATDGSQFGSGSSRAGATGLSTPGSPNSPSSSSSSKLSSGTGSSHSRTVVAVAAALGSLLFVAVLAILLLVRRRRRPKPHENSSLAPFIVDDTGLSDRKCAHPDEHQEPSTTTSPTPADASPSYPVASGDPRFSMVSYAYTTAPPPYQPHEQEPPYPLPCV